MILEIHYLQTDSKEIVEISSPQCIIGRSSDASYQIDMQCFSRKHLEIEVSDHDFFVTDLNSTNGVFVNGERIVPGEKTLFKNFFPIEINGEVSIYVQMSEHVLEAPLIQSKTFDPPIKKANSQKKETKGARSKIKTGHKKRNNIDLLRVLSLIVLLIAGIYYYQSSESETVTQESATQATNLKDNSQHAILPPRFQLDSEELKRLMSEDKCASTNYFCKRSQLIYPDEKYVLQGERMILFINFSQQINGLKSPFMETQKDIEKAEFLLASFAFNPEIIQEASMNSAKYLIIVALDSVEGLSRLKYALAVDVEKIPKMDVVNYKNFFSSLFYGGIHRPYKVGLRPHTQFSIF